MCLCRMLRALLLTYPVGTVKRLELRLDVIMNKLLDEGGALMVSLCENMEHTIDAIESG
jgi:hypothetical protein